jgi:hypothetical protein
MAAAGHGLDRGVHQVHRRAHHEVELVVLVLDVGGAEPRRQGGAGVVDQQVDRSGRVGEGVHGGAEPVVGGEVGGDDVDLDAVLLAQAGGHGFEPLGVARDEHQVVAATSQLAGEGVADAGGGPRDQGASSHGESMPEPGGAAGAWAATCTAERLGHGWLA